MNHCTKEQLIAFERRIASLFAAGDLPFLIHLSGGNEEQLVEIFKEVQPGDWIFSGHRSHYHYLLAGGDPDTLERMILEGNSMFVFGKAGDDAIECNFLTSSVLAGMCGVASGVAWQIKQEFVDKPSITRIPIVWCFIGDGAEDEGHFYEAVRFVEGWVLPCVFVIEDNNRSVDTSKLLRRGTVLNHKWPECVRRYHYTPTYPHGGAGLKTMIPFKAEAVSRALART